MFPISFHLADNIFGTDHPAHQNTGKEGDKRHQEAVADIIHYIQQLCSGTIWKRQFKVQCIISKADQHGGDKRIDPDHAAHLFTGFVEDLHTVSNQGFHNGYAGSKCSKAHH